MSTSLEMIAIEKRYGDVSAVKGLSLHVAPGEFVTLLGPSGSGKTTALKLIAGFEYPTSGEIKLGGESIGQLPPYKRGIGMVFQNYALFPHMSVAENVAFPLTVRKTPRAVTAKRVQNALEMVRLDGFGARLPSQLSGGQQQRIALARAIVFNPRILLMDEPLGALDRNLREHMKSEITRIQKQLDVTVIFVTHDQDEALTMSDRIAVMRSGKIEQIDNSRTLYNHPSNRFVAEFLGESNLIPCTLHTVEGDMARISLPGEETIRTAPISSPISDNAAWFFIRPEHLCLSETASAHTAGLDGVVRDAVFLGEATRYTVDCGDYALTVKRQNADQTFYRPDDRVHVSWHPDTTLIVGDGE